jgi:hypothetical protein
MMAGAALKKLPHSRGLSMNKLVKQLSAHTLAAWDTENHCLPWRLQGMPTGHWPCWTGWMRRIVYLNAHPPATPHCPPPP